MAVLSLTASARPALQPFPRECVWGNGAVDASALPVVRDDVRQCAIGADEVLATGAMDVTRFLPHTVRVGDAEIGPADFLFAALTFLTTEAETVTVRPREQLGDIASKLPNMATFKCAGTWRYMPEFKDNWISNRLRWQFWTLRYE